MIKRAIYDTQKAKNNVPFETKDIITTILWALLFISGVIIQVYYDTISYHQAILPFHTNYRKKHRHRRRHSRHRRRSSRSNGQTSSGVTSGFRTSTSTSGTSNSYSNTRSSPNLVFDEREPLLFHHQANFFYHSNQPDQCPRDSNRREYESI